MTSPSDIPGVRAGAFQGIPALMIDTPHAHAAISLFGGQVLSYTPAGFDDLLWVSPSTARPPKAIRGGIPICWPWFAKQGVAPESPQHGLVRATPWKIVRSTVHANTDIELALAPVDEAVHTMRVEQTIRIGGELTQSLTTTNTTTGTFSLTDAFHTYFRVGDAERIGITGLAGLTYLDKPSDFAKKVQTEPFRLHAECDRIYLDAQGDYVLDDPVLARRVRMRSRGSRALVVWNPNAEKIKTFVDIPHHGWRTYFCLEVANAGADVVMIAPGATHRIEQILSVEAIN